jgi:RNA polymerase sigma-70 factor (ECF subfamily)
MSSADARVKRDEEVLAMLQGDDPDAARTLIEVFGDRVYGLSVRILGSEEDAKESVQETFLTVWRKWDTFKGRSQFSSWIYRIAANQAYMKLRKKRKRMNDISLDQLDPKQQSALEAPGTDSAIIATWKPPVPPPDAQLEQRERAAMIDAAVAALPPIYRTAYMLKDIEGLPLKEIAKAMDLSEAAVKSRVHRARLALRRKLAPMLRAGTGGDAE